MEIGECWLVLSKEGNNVKKSGVTPAEAQLLRELHGKNCGGNPITQLKVQGEAQVRGRSTDGVVVRARTAKEEYSRLMSVYQQKTVKALFPGLNPQMPETFVEAGFEEGQAWQQVSKVEISHGGTPSIHDLAFIEGDPTGGPEAQEVIPGT